jgi:hypothetical protein
MRYYRSAGFGSSLLALILTSACVHAINISEPDRETGCTLVVPPAVASPTIKAGEIKAQVDSTLVSASGIDISSSITKLWPDASVQQGVDSYIECQVQRRNGLNQKQLNHFRSHRDFLRTNPTPDQLLLWESRNPFPPDDSTNTPPIRQPGTATKRSHHTRRVQVGFGPSGNLGFLGSSSMSALAFNATGRINTHDSTKTWLRRLAFGVQINSQSVNNFTNGRLTRISMQVGPWLRGTPFDLTCGPIWSRLSTRTSGHTTGIGFALTTSATLHLLGKIGVRLGTTFDIQRFSASNHLSDDVFIKPNGSADLLFVVALD